MNFHLPRIVRSYPSKISETTIDRIVSGSNQEPLTTINKPSYYLPTQYVLLSATQLSLINAKQRSLQSKPSREKQEDKEKCVFRSLFTFQQVIENIGDGWAAESHLISSS
eukprot:GHVP01004895.1.p1 GENE.GHVP01004895.1~~GHVP01004895.1.p1  ORF type:complete len:110 (+),score=7.49 GHVP01004895.1:303-632(+)